MRGVHLNLAAWQERSVANGPGERFVLWLQGCPLHCPGCINSEMQPFETRRVVSVAEMVTRILAIPGIEGVTYTGGEPMAQAEALALLSEQLLERGLTVVCYTGYSFDALRSRNDAWIARLLACTDILIDGPYLQEQTAPLPWRGSGNQRVHFLSGAYRHLVGGVDQPVSEVECIVGRDGFAVTGLWPEGFLQRLHQVLRSQ